MKYIWGIILFVVGFVGASAFATTIFGGGHDTVPTIEWEAATPAEREAWLAHVTNEIERGIRDSLPSKTRGSEVGIRVKDTSYEVDQRRINVDLQMTSYGVLSVSQTEARKMFVSRTCPMYRRSVLANSDVIIRYTMHDARGGKIIQFLNSPRVCSRV